MTMNTDKRLKENKLTKKWLEEQIMDEIKSAKMYRERGFPQIARDEVEHAKILRETLLKVM